MQFYAGQNTICLTLQESCQRLGSLGWVVKFNPCLHSLCLPWQVGLGAHRCSFSGMYLRVVSIPHPFHEIWVIHLVYCKNLRPKVTWLYYIKNKREILPRDWFLQLHSKRCLEGWAILKQNDKQRATSSPYQDISSKPWDDRVGSYFKRAGSLKSPEASIHSIVSEYSENVTISSHHFNGHFTRTWRWFSAIVCLSWI